METFWQDVRFALRTLTNNPGFTIVAVLVLALGIGATTAVFSVVNAVLIRPLPYVDASRLVAITSVFQPGSTNRNVAVVVLSEVEEWRKESRALESMGAFAYTELPVQIGDQAHSPVTALMDPEFLPTLGNPLAMGTMFSDRVSTGSDYTVIISHPFWMTAFAGDPRVVGRPITVDGELYTVRGVLAADFEFPRSDASYFTRDIELLMPAATFPNFPSASRQWFGIARLGPNVSLTSAQEELQNIARNVAERTAKNKDWSVQLTPLGEETTRRSRTALLITLGISVILLLIACSNLMNLLFSRGASRVRELAIRKAIGSTTGRLVRQLLTESLALALAGGFVGIFVAWFSTDALVALSPVHLPVTRSISIDPFVLIFTFVICIAAALLSGFFPAIHVSLKTDEAVRNPATRTTLSRAFGRIQQTLCVTQIALGVGLLASAGVLTHSLWRLTTVDPGYRRENIFGFSLAVPTGSTEIGSMEQRKRFYASALEQVRAIAGVQSVGWITFLPPETRAGVFMGLTIEGAEPLAPNAPPRVANHMISSDGYFSTIGIQVLRGRDFSSADHDRSPPVIIVNEALVRRYFPNEDALGRRMGTQFDNSRPVREIIGVVKDTRDRGLGVEPIPTVYIPFQQFALPYGSIAVRATVPAEAIIPEIRRRIAGINSTIPLTNFQTVSDRINESLTEPRFYTLMAAACAGMAVLFVTLGLYGLVSFSVSRRTSEFGIRMAVGAPQRAILRLVLLQGLRMAAVGVAAGVALSLMFSRVLRSLLFEVKPVDVATLVPAAVIVVVVTLLASYVPARRASRVNPIVALRHE